MNAKGLLGAGLVIAALCLAGGGVFALHTLKQDGFDPVTLCPSEGSRSITLIIVDSTDALTAAERRGARSIVERERDGAGRGDRIIVKLLKQQGGDPVLDTVADLCNPGADANPLFENPKKVAALYRDGFLEPIEGALSSLKAAQPAPASPIALAIATALADLPSKQERGKIILISGLMEHSADASAYTGTFSERALRKMIPRTVQSQMKDIDVKVLLLRRPAYAAEQNSAVAIWRHFLKAASGRDPVIARL